MFEISQSVDAARRAELCAPASFQAIATAIVRYATDKNSLQFLPEPGNHAMQGYSRPTFQLKVDEATGNQFFSSPVGYRSAYAHSVKCGEEINRRLLDQLTPLLLETASAKRKSAIRVALSNKWAKAWIWQGGGQFHNSFDATEPELLVPQWLANRERAIAFGIERLKDLPRAEQPLERKAIWGVPPHGPIRRLEILGAWMNEADEVVPPSSEKQGRSNDIHQYGFA
jgi:hypothetical protein